MVIAGSFLTLWLSHVPGAAAWAGPRMKTNTALCLTAAALSLLLGFRRRPSGLQSAIAGGVSLIAALTLMEIVSGASFGIDQLLANDPPPGSAAFPNRMSPNAAVALLLLGWALIWMKSPRRTRAAAGQLLTFVVIGIGLLALIGYLYDASALYEPTHLIRISPYTSAVLVLLGLGTLGLRLDVGLLRLLVKRDIAGYLARPLLLAATIVPILFGLIVVTGIRNGLFDAALGTALLTSSTIVAFVVVIGALARSIEAVDGRRNIAEARLRRAATLTAELALAATVDQVVDITVRLGVPALEAHAGGVYLLSGEGQDLLLVSTIGYESQALDAYRIIPLSAPFPVAAAVRARRNVFLATQEECLEGFPGMADRLLASEPSRVALPLEARGQVLGGLVLTFDRPQTFDEETRARLSSLASQCAQSLDRARLFDSERAANKAKDEFLAMLGHELRNPLAPIITSLELMKIRGDAFPAERAIIGRHVLRLNRLVDDLMDVARVAGGKVELRRRRVELHDCVVEALEAASLLFENGGHYVDVSVPKTGLPVFADPQRLTQVISNLLTNAAKYTDRGGHIDIAAYRTVDSIVLDVKDDGIGIPAALLPRIFDLFTQGRSTTARSQGGLGLGLAIVRSVVQMHGGTIAVRSDGPAKGSTFTVTLPLDTSGPRETPPSFPSAPKTAGRPKLADGQPAACRILVVDDNEDAAETLADLLRLDGHEVRVAGDGPTALVVAESFDPQLAFLDIGLPVMDGWEVAKTLRSKRAGRPLTLIAMTGYGQDEDRARSAAAGFDSHLVKPLDVGRALQIAAEAAARPS
ncbi:MAG: hypothetical protein JWM82_2911 [Myxococcales bacterium]|nr:hypothetical protein [Myxococcales bacterium]